MHRFDCGANRNDAPNLPQQTRFSWPARAPARFEKRERPCHKRQVRNGIFKTPIRLSRRSAILAGGGAAAVAAGAAIAIRPRTQDISFLEGVDLSGARALGEGFYEVEGWVLTADDIRRLGGPAPAGD